jgi:HlyD family secretion protein
MHMGESNDSAVAKPRRKRRARRLLWVIIGVVIVGGVGTWMKMKANGKAKAQAAVVRTADVARDSVVQTISSTGVIAGETGADVKIGSQISGRIKKLYTDLGKQVKPGQVVAEIDAPDLRASLESARRSLAQSTARYQQQLEGVGMQHTQVSGAFEQASESLRRSESSRQRSQASLASARGRVTSAESSLVGAKARLRQAESRVRSSQAAETSQPLQTSAQIRSAQAALNTSKANLTQVTKSTALEVANAEAAVRTAQSNAALAASNARRQQALLDKGYVSAQDAESARTQSEVQAQAVLTSQANLSLTKEKVAADLESAQNQVRQSEASLVVAQANTSQDVARTEDARTAQAALEDSRQSVAQAEIAVASAKSDLTSAQADLEGAQADVRSSRAALQTALGNMTQDRLKQQDVKAAYEAMMQATAQVTFQDSQYQKSYIRSTIAGTVISLTQQEGETVAAGLSAPTLMEVVDLSRLEADAYVDETDIGQVKVGQPVSVEVDAYPDRKFPGHIVRIASTATTQNNVVTYLVTVDLDKYPAGMLKPQMPCTVKVIIARADNVVTVPAAAIKQKKEGTQIVVLNGDKAEVRTIKIGLTDGEKTEVTEGLNEGEKVVLAGFEKLGVEGFTSAAALPGFAKNGSPFGPMGGGKGGGSKGGGGRGGGR